MANTDEQLLKGTHSLTHSPAHLSVTLFRWRRPPLLPLSPLGIFFPPFFMKVKLL